MFRRLFASAVVLTALMGFGSFAGFEAPSKPACCKPSHCLAQISTKTCCKAGPSREVADVAPFSNSPVQKLALYSEFSIVKPAVDRPFLRRVVSFRAFSTAPPVIDLKSSLLI